MVKVGLKMLELDWIATRGSNGANNTDLSIKSTENSVWAVLKLTDVNPLTSNKALKALVEPSVVKLGW